jgi:hypothetical protein
MTKTTVALVSMLHVQHAINAQNVVQDLTKDSLPSCVAGECGRMGR